MCACHTRFDSRFSYKGFASEEIIEHMYCISVWL